MAFTLLLMKKLMVVRLRLSIYRLQRRSFLIIGKAGISPGADEGVVKVNNADDASSFLKQCRKIKLWSREDKTKMADAK